MEETDSLRRALMRRVLLVLEKRGRKNFSLCIVQIRATVISIWFQSCITEELSDEPDRVSSDL